MDSFGLSFSPTNLPDRMNGTPGSQPSATGPFNPVQDAIRTLNYRIPRSVGVHGIAPSPLLNAQGAAGFTGSAPMGSPPSAVGPQTAPRNQGNPVVDELEQWLRKLLGNAPASQVDGNRPATQPTDSVNPPPVSSQASNFDPRIIPGHSGEEPPRRRPDTDPGKPLPWLVPDVGSPKKLGTIFDVSPKKFGGY